MNSVISHYENLALSIDPKYIEEYMYYLNQFKCAYLNLTNLHDTNYELKALYELDLYDSRANLEYILFDNDYDYN